MKRPRFDSLGGRRGGLTMVELLIAAAVSIIIILAVVQIFRVASETIAQGRAAIEMSGETRGVAARLRDDLSGLTASTRPWPTADAAHGYLEYIEGPGSDSNSGMPAFGTVGGDIDDYLAFTAKSNGKPFVGRFNGNVIESDTAEIIWWVATVNGRTMLFRRVLLIRPDLGPVALTPPVPPAFYQFFNQYDISARLDTSTVPPRMVMNTLADLTKRENRFAHDTTTFPHQVDLAALGRTALSPPPPPGTGPGFIRDGNFTGEDVILSNVVAFDVRVFEPNVPVFDHPVAGRTLAPGDPGYINNWLTAAAPPAPPWPSSQGAYVDLDFVDRGNLVPSTSAAYWFSMAPQGPSRGDLPGLTSQQDSPMSPTRFGVWNQPTYCTWSFHYEYILSASAEAANGIDDNNQYGVDDSTERVTSPPYPYPLRGMEITIRVLDLQTQQVRQTVVTSDFTPE